MRERLLPARELLGKVEASRALQFVLRLAERIQKDDVPGLAAEMAFRFLFALFPFLIFLAAFLGFIRAQTGVGDMFGVVMALIGLLAPAEIQSVLNDWVEGVVRTRSTGLLTIGAAGALWGGAGGVGTLLKGLNRAYDVHETRPVWKVQVITLVTTAALAVFMLGGALLYTFGGWLGNWLEATLELGGGFLGLWGILKGPGVALGLGLALLVLYVALPNAPVHLHYAAVGAAVSTASWVALTVGFSFYMSNLGSYNLIFGSLGAAVVLMVWMYAVGLILLLGGELNAALAATPAAESFDAGNGTPA